MPAKSTRKPPFPERVFNSMCVACAAIGVFIWVGISKTIIAVGLAVCLLLAISITAVVVGGIFNYIYRPSIRHIEEPRTRNTKITEGDD